MEKLKLKIKQKEKAVKMMSDEFAECVRLAEEKNDMSFLIIGNRLKRKSNKTKEDIASLEETIFRKIEAYELNQFFIFLLSFLKNTLFFFVSTSG